MGLLDKFGMKGSKAKDLVCGMDVDTKNPPGGTASHAGTVYYFCSPGCRKRFEADPKKYVDPAHKPEGMGH